MKNGAPGADGIECTEVDFHYQRDAGAFRQLTFSVPRGAILGVIGRSGAGKSTLIKLLGGHLLPHTGRIAFDGVDVTLQPANGRPSATVFQENLLFPHMTVLQNMEFGLDGRHISRSATDGVVGLLGLNGLLGRYPKELSGGEAQRVALARAILRKPKVLLLDEPFASLDAYTRRSARDAVLQVLDASMSVVIVSHDFSELATIADMCIVLSRFALAQVGTADELIARPVSLDVVQTVPGFVRVGSGATAFFCHESLLSIRKLSGSGASRHPVTGTVIRSGRDQYGLVATIRLEGSTADARASDVTSVEPGETVEVHCAQQLRFPT